jgi:hypothetical protein
MRKAEKESPWKARKQKYGREKALVASDRQRGSFVERIEDVMIFQPFQSRSEERECDVRE